MKELQYINRFFIKYRGRLLIGLLVTIIAAVFKVIVPSLIGDSMDLVANYMRGEITDLEFLKTELKKNIWLLIGTTLLGALFTFIMRQTIIVVSRYIEFDLKNEVYKQYQRLSLNFYKQNRTGDLMNRISEDVGKVRMYTGPALMYSTTTITLFLVVLPYMFYIAPMLTLYVVAPLPILSVCIYRLSIAIHKRSTVVQQYLSKLTTFTQESFSGISVIKAYGIEPRINSEFVTLSETSRDKNLELVKIQALFFPLMVLLIGVSNLLVIYIGGKQYIDGLVDFGTIVQFLIYVNMLTWPVAIVGWVSSMVQQAEASQKRINEFLKEVPSIQNTVTQEQTVAGTITFKNLSFTYEDTNIIALKNVSFSVKAGETLAIVGNTGSGKSTILELIGRLYDVENGMLLVDDIPIAKRNLKNLREAIGYVPQDAFYLVIVLKTTSNLEKKTLRMRKLSMLLKTPLCTQI